MAYGFPDRQLLGWDDRPQAAALWERATNAEHNATYWKRRAESAERRMREHVCTGDSA